MLDKDFPAVACNTFGGEKWIVDDRDDWREQREERSWDFRLKLDLLKIHLKQKAEFINFSLMGDPDVMTKLAAVLAKRFL